MPTFVANGPFVPDHLVQDLEDDRVILFCGAGISMGAGLPSYGGLVEHCYNELGETLPTNRSSDWQWPDRMLGALENRFPADMRRTVAKRLDQPPVDLAIHRAILELATSRSTKQSRPARHASGPYSDHAKEPPDGGGRRAKLQRKYPCAYRRFAYATAQWNPKPDSYVRRQTLAPHLELQPVTV